MHSDMSLALKCMRDKLKTKITATGRKTLICVMTADIYGACQCVAPECGHLPNICQFVLQKTHCVSITNIGLLMLFIKVPFVDFERHRNPQTPKKLVQAVTLLTCISEVPASNFCRDTHC
jgi:hypothetical protein